MSEHDAPSNGQVFLAIVIICSGIGFEEAYDSVVVGIIVFVVMIAAWIGWRRLPE